MTTAADLRQWGRILCPEPPPLRHHTEDMIDLAEAMLAAQMAAFPIQIAEGNRTQENADAHLATSRALIADLTWLQQSRRGGGAGPSALTEDTRAAIASKLDMAIERLGTRATRQNGKLTPEQSEQAHILIAIRWNYEPENVWPARRTRQAQIYQPERKAA